MKKKGMAKGGYRGGVKKMKKGGAAGGVAVEELNPGKTMDVTGMAMGGVKRRAKGGAAGGLNAAIKRVKANK